MISSFTTVKRVSTAQNLRLEVDDLIRILNCKDVSTSFIEEHESCASVVEQEIEEWIKDAPTTDKWRELLFPPRLVAQS